MASGGRSGPTGGHGREVPGDQRTLGRAAYRPRAGSGLMSVQQGDDEMLRYLADVGRGVPPKPRATGFGSVRRR